MLQNLQGGVAKLERVDDPNPRRARCSVILRLSISRASGERRGVMDSSNLRRQMPIMRLN